jgi:mannose-6-phosphate isomerase-like protein (cupin superfamily)
LKKREDEHMRMHQKNASVKTPDKLEVAKYKENVDHINLSQLKESFRWLFGKGEALYHSNFMSMYYNETEKGWMEIDPYLHYHKKAEEYYISLEGSLTIQVDTNFIKVEPYQLLRVNPKTPHGIVSVKTPFRGFTIRVPLTLDDKVVLKNKKLGKPIKANRKTAMLF